MLTVSPVTLEATATDNDVVVANLESKSLLRAVAGQVSREFDNVHYFPSYELAMYYDIFEEDGRHVTREAVARIIAWSRFRQLESPHLRPPPRALIPRP